MREEEKLIKSSNKKIANEQQLNLTIIKPSTIKRILRSVGLTYIRPTIDPHVQGGIAFHDAEVFFGISGEEMEKLLENLASMGVFNKLLLDIIKTCPYCGSPLIDIEEVCPNCESKNISKINGDLRCELCLSTFSSPKLSLLCKKCGNSFDASQARSRPLFSYLMSENASASEEAPTEIELTGKLYFSDSLTKNLKGTLDGFLQKMDELLSSYLEKIYQLGSNVTYAGVVPEKAVQRTLPSHLEKTLQALRILGKATAEQVAGQTGRTRAIESVYLNQLVNLDVVEKERIGRKCYYHIKQ